MPNYQVEKGIPIAKTKRPGFNNYPFDQMEIGDSFLIPQEVLKTKKNISIFQSSVATTARQYNQYHKKDMKFKTGQVPEGLRVWRIR